MTAAAVAAGTTRTTRRSGWSARNVQTSVALEPTGRHHAIDLFTLTLRTDNIIAPTQDQIFKFLIALLTFVFIDRHYQAPPLTLLYSLI
jgi:hypothetical protein